MVFDCIDPAGGPTKAENRPCCPGPLLTSDRIVGDRLRCRCHLLFGGSNGSGSPPAPVVDILIRHGETLADMRRPLQLVEERHRVVFR